MNKWKEIWDKDGRVDKIILESLIKADGFDSGAGSFSVDNWIAYTKSLYEKAKIVEGNSIYEIGCGSGAFIYSLYLKDYKIGGLDYSKDLIKLTTRIMPNCNFINKEAIDMDIDKTYDIVMSHSVFHYFKDLDYAKNVVKKMIKKSNNKIAIFDINNEDTKDEYHKTRMQNISKSEYEKKYAGFEHLFYSKKWFEDIANEFNLKITILNQDFKEYSNSKLRFNIIMEKK